MKTAVLLVNLGTPEQPDEKSIKRYLSQFLMDRRVVDLSPLLWGPLLKGVILPKRIPKVSRLYQDIWTPEGSPLLVYSRQIQQALRDCLSKDIIVELAMSYGQPAIDDVLNELLSEGIDRLIVLPLYPQYSSTTTGAVWDGLNRVLTKRRNLPETYFIRDYASHPLYIKALTNSVKQSFNQYGRPERLVISYHGIPTRYVKEGDDYPYRCQVTTDALINELDLLPDEYLIAYQSRFGKQEWLSPYTDEMISQLAEQGVKNIQVICPGFAVDCLETLHEVAVEYKNLFIEKGGQEYRYIPALNSSDAHIEFLLQLITSHIVE